MWRVCWVRKDRPDRVYRTDGASLAAVRRFAGHMDACFPDERHWLGSVENPNVLVKVPGPSGNIWVGE